MKRERRRGWGRKRGRRSSPVPSPGRVSGTREERGRPPPFFPLSLSLPPSPAASSPYYVSGPAFFPAGRSPPLSLPPTDPLRLVLRSAREARVLPVPIVSCMINDRVDLSPTAYASFRALDAAIDREGGAAKFERRTRRHLRYDFKKKNRIETAIRV